MLLGMNEQDYQRPEGKLIESARSLLRPKLSGNKAAERAGLSASRWHQIVRGFQWVGAQQMVAVEGPAETVARMAQVVGVSPADLRDAGRGDAADVLEVLGELKPARAEARTHLRTLIEIREEIDSLIDEMRRG